MEMRIEMSIFGGEAENTVHKFRKPTLSFSLLFLSLDWEVSTQGGLEDFVFSYIAFRKGFCLSIFFGKIKSSSR